MKSMFIKVQLSFGIQRNSEMFANLPAKKSPKIYLIPILSTIKYYKVLKGNGNNDLFGKE